MKYITIKLLSLISLLICPITIKTYSQVETPVPFELRGHKDYERVGQQDANNIRTRFWNYGMAGDYPADPINVDLSVFHSMEWPKGSLENYSDGTTPFVLAKIIQRNGGEAYIMETGYRERQGTSPFRNRVMRFEPRPGYFEPNPDINQGESPAVSNDPRTWPAEWIDKLNDPDDPGWSGSWNGYFGKAIVADQESYCVYDDQYYDAWDYFPDSRDEGQPPLERRRGLGLRVEQRGFQWSNPQSKDVLFFHYDISNESTTSYEDNIIFGLYMDSGVGGSTRGRDGVAESDDDNAFFDREIGLNLVYTWDQYGWGARGPTGYLGYSYLETPGNSTDGIDNDLDGMLDERRDGGPGQLLQGQDAIRAYANANYNMELFESFFGLLEDRPAYIEGYWWTGDEDMDWLREFSDTGADGLFETGDTGEGDGMPTQGEPNFDRTDIDESDQIGLTGFKMNRIRAADGVSPVDNVNFFTGQTNWPERLYQQFSNPEAAFDESLVLNYNIGFLFASGPFKLEAGKTERFSLALGFGMNLRELRNTTKIVLQIYEGNYQFAVPPPLPIVQSFAGDGFVTLTWSDDSERAYDPTLQKNDFEGYRIYRSTDPAFLDPREDPTNEASILNGTSIAQFDLINNIAGYSNLTVEGKAYFLGEDTGITHTFTDNTVTNGQLYYYAVCAYDRGDDEFEVFPSENPISVNQTLRGGTILPPNVVEVRPNGRALGYTPANVFDVQHVEGTGIGNVNVAVLNSDLVPDNHEFRITFTNDPDSVHANFYQLTDATTGETIFEFGADFDSLGTGPIGNGLLPFVKTLKTIQIDSANTGFTSESSTNISLNITYQEAVLPVNLRRPGFPENLQIVFSDAVQDTSIAAIGRPAKQAKFRILAKTNSGDLPMNFILNDPNNSGTLDQRDEYIDVVTYTQQNPNSARATWRFIIPEVTGTVDPPGEGDVYSLALLKPFATGDVFTFKSAGAKINAEQAADEFKPYVVPNPYVAAASFEPQRFAVSGRGERRIEFRGLPQNCTIRIFTVSGELVQTLEHSGAVSDGYIPWDLRSIDNLEVAPGLYIYHVDAGQTGEFIGKFAIIK